MTELLEQAIAAHGGREAWAALGELSLGLRSGGLAFRAKGQPRAMCDVRAHVTTAGGQQVVFEPFPRPGSRGVFDADGARIESGGTIDGVTDRPRGLRWSPVDMLAFAGAALWTYVSFPFVLAAPGFHVRELPGRRLEVTPGPGVVTHAPRHVLWIGDDGLIARHDYTAVAITGRLARAANLILEHDRVGGVTLATRRRVVPRGLRDHALPGPTLVWIELDLATRAGRC